MKYFTTEWWKSGCDDAEDLFKRYEEHFASMRSRLPRGMIEIRESHTLHDSEVKKIECHFQKSTLTIDLLGWDVDLQFPVRYVLLYSGVVEFEQTFPPDEYVPFELGDMGYWECDIVPAGIEMRMLFASDAEFRIVFHGFEFKHAKVEA